MALQKTKNLANGATGNYWKITSVQIDKNKLTASWVITLFADQAHADNGSPSLGLSYPFKGTFTKQQLAADVSALGYATVKALVLTAKPRIAVFTPANAWDDLAGTSDI